MQHNSQGPEPAWVDKENAAHVYPNEEWHSVIFKNVDESKFVMLNGILQIHKDGHHMFYLDLNICVLIINNELKIKREASRG